MKTIRDLVAYYNTELERDSRYEVVEYLLENLSELDTLSMAQVAKETYVSKSTVSRLARRFGFEDYDELLDAARLHTKQDYPSVLRMGPADVRLLRESPDEFLAGYVDEVIASLELLKSSVKTEEIDELIALALAKPTALFASDKPLMIARDLQSAFLSVHKLVQVGETKQKRIQIAQTLPAEGLAVVFSNYGRYIEGNRQMLEEMRRRGVTLWLVTLCYNGPSTFLFDHVISLSGGTYVNTGIYSLRVFVEFLVRRLIVGRVER